MTRQVIYRYLGTNGVIESPVHLEDVYFTRLIKLTADEDKILFNGKIYTPSTITPEDNEKDWVEVSFKGQT